MLSKKDLDQKNAFRRKRYKHMPTPKVGTRAENAKSKKFVPLNAFWNCKAQAYNFWFQVYVQYKSTEQQAIRDILMTLKQLRWLRSNAAPTEHAVLRAIYKKRRRTCREFMYLCQHPKNAAKYRIAESAETSLTGNAL